MIYVRNIKEVKQGQFDAVFAIVRSYKGKQTWIKQMAELSPSWNLFTTYRDLARRNEWNAETFQKIYVPKFLKEMHEPSARDYLNMVYALGKRSSVALVCYCSDETLCHRSIVAGLLQGVGAEVELPSGADYSRYYNYYKMKGE